MATSWCVMYEYTVWSYVFTRMYLSYGFIFVVPFPKTISKNPENPWWTRLSWPSKPQSTYRYIEYPHNVCPLVGIGTLPHPLPQASVQVCIPALLMIFEHHKASLTPPPAGYGRAGCIPGNLAVWTRAECLSTTSSLDACRVSFHHQQYRRVQSVFPPPAV